MKLNLEVIPDTTPSAADRMTPQAAQYLGQIMQLMGIETIEYSLSSKSYTPSDIKVSHMDCPDAVKDLAKSSAYYLCGLMHEFNLSKLSYEYTHGDIETLKPIWDQAVAGISRTSLLTPPEVIPDMERVEIDL